MLSARGRPIGGVRQHHEGAVLPERGIEGDGLPDSKPLHAREARRINQAEIRIAIREVASAPSRAARAAGVQHLGGDFR